MSTRITDVGSGYSTFTGSAAGSKIINVDKSTRGGESTLTIYSCKNSQDLATALDINASVAGSSGWGSFDAKMKFMESLKTSSTTITILVSATQVVGTTTGTNPVFKASVTSALDIYRQAGDSYVSSIIEGGQFLAAYSFVSYDEETYRQLDASADAQFKGFGSDLQADFSSSIKKMSNIANVTTTSKVTCIGLDTGLPADPDAIVAFAQNFGNMELHSPDILDFTTLSYSDVPGCPEFTQIDTYRQAYFDPLNPTMRWADIELAANAVVNAVKDVVQLYNNYGFLSVDETLQNYLPHVVDILTQISQWRQSVDRDPTRNDIVDPVIHSEYLATPIPSYTLLPGGAVGADSGSAWNDITLENIANGVLPKDVTIWGDQWISGISTTYVQNDESAPTFTKAWGSLGNNTMWPTIQLMPPGELITEVTAFYDNHITRLTIQTTNQPAVTSPHNQNGANSKLWVIPHPGSSCFVGFQGRLDGIPTLAAIEPCFVYFQPATWQSFSNLKPHFG